MRKKHFYILLVVVGFVALLSLLLLFIGLFSPDTGSMALGGFERVFDSFPDFSYDSGSIVTSFGDYSISVNLGFNKPFLAFMSETSTVMHIHVIFVVAVLVGVFVSCFFPEVSSVTSAAVAVFELIAVIRMLDGLKAVCAAKGSWEGAVGCFWIMAFFLAFLIFNGMIGIGYKMLGSIFPTVELQFVSTLVLSAILANMVAIVLCALLYLTVGLGWCGGIIFWFVLAMLFTAFCEVMDFLN